MKIIFIAICIVLFLFGLFAVAAVMAGAKAEKRMKNIFENEKANRN